MTVADQVFEAVRSDIITGKISRNEMLSIYQLAERYSVSRTPVREAVLRLANVGLVVVEKNHGVRVKGLTASDVREIFQTRLLIEVPSAFYAAESNPPGVRERFTEAMERLTAAANEDNLAAFVQADRELHAIIIGWNGNAKATKIIDQIRDETHSIGASTFEDGRLLSEVLEEHVPIYEAILGGHGKRAALLMREHLTKTARLLLTKLTIVETAEGRDDEHLSEQIASVEEQHPIIFIDL